MGFCAVLFQAELLSSIKTPFLYFLHETSEETLVSHVLYRASGAGDRVRSASKKGQRRLGKYEDTRDHTPPKEGQLPKAETEEQEQEEEEEEEIVEVGQIVTTTGDVEEDSRFTSESAQILIGEIMGCNRDLEIVQQNINDVKNKIKNIIDVLGRV
ncbi:uncharacterized protein LOC143961979 [Lithobates pipiens]